MSKLLVCVKIHNYENILDYISVIRKYKEKSISTIKANILHGYAVTMNWYAPYSFYDNVNNVDPHERFLQLIEELEQAGAQLTLYEEFQDRQTEITKETLENMIKRQQEIEQDLTEEDELSFIER